MNMRGAARIRHRPDRQEIIAAGGVDEGAAEALEIVVGWAAAAALDMVVAAVLIALPDLDPRPRQWLSGAVEDAAGDTGEGPLRRLGMAGDMHEIVIGIGGQALRVERSGGLLRGGRQRLGAAH